jgi:hypothetical protein
MPLRPLRPVLIVPLMVLMALVGACTELSPADSRGPSDQTPGGEAAGAAQVEGTEEIGASDGGAASTAGESECSEEVRHCVCEEWQQSICCEGDWTTFCALTAADKCGAAPPCGQEPIVAPPSDLRANACCTTATTPGCADESVEACVCDLLPECCTVAWDSLCVQLVREQHCAPDVRTCLCDDWEQESCCSTRWTSFCTITAEEKCDAETTCP